MATKEKDLKKHARAYRDLIKPDTINFNLSHFMVEAMERVDNSVASKSRGFRGAAFELACMDMFMKAGVSRDYIHTAYEMKTLWPGLDAYNIDMDVCIINKDKGVYVPFLLKTSLRERWKQHDRDAGLANGYVKWKMLEAYAVVYNEKATSEKNTLVWKTREAHIDRLRRIYSRLECMCVTRISWFSAYDSERLDEVFLGVIKQVTA